MKKTTKRLQRSKEIDEALEAGDECFEKLMRKRTERKAKAGDEEQSQAPIIKLKNLEHHKRTKTLFQALKEDDLSTGAMAVSG